MTLGNALEMIAHVADKAKGKANEAKQRMKMDEDHRLEIPHKDLTIQFIGASGLPQMDVSGNADPYFVANINDKIKFVSTIQVNTLKPVWNEIWRVKNVPSTATLEIKVMDKDDGQKNDDYIGKFEVSVAEGAKEVEIEGPLFKRNKGSFWLKIEAKPSDMEQAKLYPYLFDGPVRYSRHNSPTVGKLTHLNDERLYSTWKMYLRGIPLFFDHKQHWNVEYSAAKEIFTGPTGLAARSGIRAAHSILYARSTTNGFGVINGPDDVFALLWGGPMPGPKGQETTHRRVKPTIYTYAIAPQDDSMRFSETGAAFLVDFASKHALHSSCAEEVWYSGEFHPRPKGGWGAFSDETPDDKVEWELVIDNSSGTYGPKKEDLPCLQKLLEFNFPGFTILALDFNDEERKKSVKETKDYAVEHRSVREVDFEPHKHDSEDTLAHAAKNMSIKDAGQHTAQVLREN